MQPATRNVDRLRTILAAALATLAGAVDALGFIALGGFFISFMTGNTTRLAVGLAEGRLHQAASGVALVVLFVTGAIGGFVAANASRAHPKQAVAALLTILLAVAALCHDAGVDTAAIALTTFAMGAENAIFRSETGQTIGLTYMTGTLVKMAGLIVDACAGGSNLAWLRQFALWASLAAGAVLGGLAYRWIGLDALWLIAACSTVIAAVLGRLPPGA